MTWTETEVLDQPHYSIEHGGFELSLRPGYVAELRSGICGPRTLVKAWTIDKNRTVREAQAIAEAKAKNLLQEYASRSLDFSERLAT